MPWVGNALTRANVRGVMLELPGGDDAAGSVIRASRDWVLGVFVEPVHTVVPW